MKVNEKISQALNDIERLNEKALVANLTPRERMRIALLKRACVKDALAANETCQKTERKESPYEEE
jgi:hypothetical protein